MICARGYRSASVSVRCASVWSFCVGLLCWSSVLDLLCWSSVLVFCVVRRPSKCVVVSVRLKAEGSREFRKVITAAVHVRMIFRRSDHFPSGVPIFFLGSLA